MTLSLETCQYFGLFVVVFVDGVLCCDHSVAVLFTFWRTSDMINVVNKEKKTLFDHLGMHRSNFSFPIPELWVPFDAEDQSDISV